jgi:DNA methylase
VSELEAAVSQALVPAMNAEEARALTDEVTRDAGALREKLLRLYEGQAHVALGYASWQAYWEAEFDTHWRSGYRELQAARVDRVIGPWANGPLPERQARELAPLLREDPQAVLDAWGEAEESATARGVEITASLISDVVRASEKQRDRRKRTERLQAVRAAAEAEAKKTIERLGAKACIITEADVHTWRPKGVDCIVTDPPYVTDDAVELYSALADFAVDVLPDGGALVAMCWAPILPDVFQAMSRPDLIFRWLIEWRFATEELGNASTFDFARRVFDTGKPVLVFHKRGWANDAPALHGHVQSHGRAASAAAIENGRPGKKDTSGDLHVWEQGVAGVEKLVQYASQPGDTICDPFAGSGTTAVAALANARRFVGCDVDPAAVETSLARLAA